MYPFPLEVKEAARNRILSTCLNDDVNLKERALKNKEKIWVGVRRDVIILPYIGPLYRYVTIQPQLWRWLSVKMLITLQFMKGLNARSSRGSNPQYEMKSGL